MRYIPSESKRRFELDDGFVWEDRVDGRERKRERERERKRESERERERNLCVSLSLSQTH